MTKSLALLLAVALVALTNGRKPCSDASMDAVTSIGRTTYAFKGEMYYTLTKHRSSGAHIIATRFPGLPSNMDAAVHWPAYSGKVARTYFFKGNDYYRFEGKHLMAGYPKKISCGFPGVPNNIDTAFLYRSNTYFIKDDVYYTFNRNSGKASSGIPRKSSHIFRYAPSNPSAVSYISAKRHYYYFVGKKFYKMHSAVMASSSHYPKEIASYWFNC